MYLRPFYIQHPVTDHFTGKVLFCLTLSLARLYYSDKFPKKIHPNIIRTFNCIMCWNFILKHKTKSNAANSSYTKFCTKFNSPTNLDRKVKSMAKIKLQYIYLMHTNVNESVGRPHSKGSSIFTQSTYFYKIELVPFFFSSHSS